MPRQHVVRQGEHISSIAARYGFDNDDAIWRHPDNAALRSKRRSPHILAPGDALAIPDLAEKELEVSTGQKHRFVVKRTSLDLAVRLLDWRAQPIAGARCKLTVDGIARAGEDDATTDGDGVLKRAIPRGARRASLEVGGVCYDLAIGHLDPLDEVSGLQTRLNSLGYQAGVPGDDDPALLRFAIELFQHDRGLDVDGEPTPALRAALEEAFGC